MAEAFATTFKHNYVWLGNLSSAEVVMRQLPKWFDDYNEIAPHKSLNLMSRRQYISKSKLAA
jgi:transposase InsO family protein